MHINDKKIFIGSKVSGSYYGVDYSGVVSDMRHVWNEKTTRVEITLNQPIDVLQLVRSDITMDLDKKGQAKNYNISCTGE